MNDAKGCYDRIAHSIASLFLQRFGIPASAIVSVFSTLQKAMHFISTGFGRSESVYGNESPPVNGIGQGNGMGPSLWAIISTGLLDMMHLANHGMRLVSPLSGSDSCIVGFGFVDNTDLVTGLFSKLAEL